MNRIVAKAKVMAGVKKGFEFLDIYPEGTKEPSREIYHGGRILGSNS